MPSLIIFVLLKLNSGYIVKKRRNLKKKGDVIGE